MSQRMQIVGLFLSLVSVSVASPALAWSDSARFTDPPSGGGGGWRFFTGSPGDSYTCANCHTGSGGLKLAVYGLPKRYVPGVTYDVAVTWTAGVNNVAGMLEIVDSLGEAAGEFSAVDASAADPASLCAGGFSPMTVFKRNPSNAGMRRQVLAASGCEATRVQARWKAPDQDVGAVNLVGGFVKPDVKPADADPTPQNDQVTILHHAIASPREPSPAPLPQTFGCQFSSGQREAGTGAWFSLALLVALVALRTRRNALIHR